MRLSWSRKSEPLDSPGSSGAGTLLDRTRRLGAMVSQVDLDTRGCRGSDRWPFRSGDGRTHEDHHRTPQGRQDEDLAALSVSRVLPKAHPHRPRRPSQDRRPPRELGSARRPRAGGSSGAAGNILRLRGVQSPREALLQYRQDPPPWPWDLGSLRCLDALPSLTLLLAISMGGQWRWTNPATVGCLAGAVVIWLAGVPWELRTSDALVDLRMSARRRVLLTNLAAVLCWLCHVREHALDHAAVAAAARLRCGLGPGGS